MAPVKKSIEDRFFSKIKKRGDDCWIWTAQIDEYGYGRIRTDLGPRGAHRLSYELHHGAIGTKELVCHRCDNRACVNPDHLFLGNHDDNMADMVAKGRQAYGKRHTRPCAKLTEREVFEIRAAKNISQRKLAAIFGIGQDGISRIRSRKRWAHI